MFVCGVGVGGGVCVGGCVWDFCDVVDELVLLVVVVLVLMVYVLVLSCVCIVVVMCWCVFV